jgi:SpoVK/Ycf46/Vps4 family AAA+-type ATPase
MNMGLRLMSHENLQKLSKEELSTIKKQDIEKIFEKQKGKVADIPVDEALLKISLRELQDLVGLSQVKKEVSELVQLVHFYREIGKDPRKEFSLHGIFKGNPGTGKTTVARIISNIYKALGILERGHLVEVDRQKLVAEFVGQTATKTNDVINKAKGGVLFIDEAYTLLHGESDTFGKEAISTLLKRMEDERGEFVVIVAGYPDNMDQFLKSNPGLKSRFDRTFTFEDYSKAEMWEIMQSMLTAEGLSADKAATEFLQNYLDKVLLHRDKYFGNGRTVRKIVEKAVKNQHLRLAQLPPEKRKPVVMRKLTLADVKEFNTDEMMDKTAGIGFRRTQSGND